NEERTTENEDSSFSVVRSSLFFASSENAELPAFRVHRRISGVPQRLPQPGALLQDRDLLRRARQRLRRRLGQDKSHVPAANATAGKLAGRGIQVADAGRVIARPAQAPRTIHLRLLTVPTQHNAPPGNVVSSSKDSAKASSLFRPLFTRRPCRRRPRHPRFPP